jgi:hypothetical protein
LQKEGKSFYNVRIDGIGSDGSSVDDEMKTCPISKGIEKGGPI